MAWPQAEAKLQLGRGDMAGNIWISDKRDMRGGGPEPSTWRLCPTELAADNMGSGRWGSQEGFFVGPGCVSVLFPLHSPWGGAEEGVYVQRSGWAGGTHLLFRQAAHADWAVLCKEAAD